MYKYKKLLLILLCASFCLVGCTSEESKMYKEIEQTFEQEKWSDAIDMANHFKETYPDDKRIESINEIISQSQQELNLIEAKDLLISIKTYDNEEKWDEIISLNKKIVSLVPNTDIAKESSTYAKKAEDIILSKLVNDMKSAYNSQKWESVLNYSSTIIDKYSNSNEVTLAKEYKITALDKINQAKEQKKKSLLKKLTPEYDKVNQTTFYYPKSRPRYINDRCSFYLYIGYRNSSDKWLRWFTSYTEDNWVFFSNITISIDGKNHTKYFNRSDIKRDNEYGDVWEYVDVSPSESELSYIKEIINSKETIIRFNGSQYYYDYKITKNDKQGLKDILDAYDAL